jgi:bacterial/archaeal transporter family-2 protein
VLALGATVISGTLVALQSRINGEFGLALGNGALAALISFATGLVVMAVAVSVSPRARAGLGILVASLREGRLPWWSAIGGLGGAFLVLTQGLSAGVLGVAVFSIAVVTGQSLGALVIDTKGWLGVDRVPLRATRFIGAVVVVLGVLVTLDLAPGSLPDAQGLFILPLVAGMGTGFQQAVNGRVKTMAGSALAATFVNFSVGTVALAITYLVMVPFTGASLTLPAQWWLWAGGIVGTIFITIQATTVTTIGVLGLGVSLVTGQLIGSILLDTFAPVSTSAVDTATVIGALVTLVGALLVTLGKKKF